jgi:hypothetical protein
MQEGKMTSRALRVHAVLFASAACAVAAACTGYVGEPELKEGTGGGGGAAGGTAGMTTAGHTGDGGVPEMTGGATGSGGSTGSGGQQAGAGGDTVGAGGGTGGGGTGGSTNTPAGDPAHELKISKVAVYQAVEIPLMQDGTTVKSLNAPIIAGRPALLRVFVTPSDSFAARDITARVTLSGSAKDLTHTVRGASTQADLGTTFNFEFSADEVTGTSTIAVNLYEVMGASATGVTDGAAWPGTGSVGLSAEAPGAFKVTIVPLAYSAGGSTELPDTSDTNIKYLTNAMFSTYPTPAVEVTLHAPLAITQTIERDGTGWSSALNKICMQRVKDKAPRNVIYYGLLAPGDFQSFCQNACVEGLAAFSQGADDDYSKCSMGLGYTGMGAGVFEQEVAHNLGRNHAPCGNPEPVDADYPYSKGKIGVWGYSLTKKLLVDPAKYVDFMSYCPQTWVSDYTYAGLFERIFELNKLVQDRLGQIAAVRYRSISVEPDGRAAIGDSGDFYTRPLGEARDVTLVAADGSTVVAKGSFYGNTRGGGALLVRESDLIGKRSITLPSGASLSLTQ